MKTILVLVLWACLLTGAKTCEHVSNDAGYFPCDKYFLFIVNKGYDITVEQFAAQKNFILNYLFNTSQWEGFNPVPWNHPERIALIAYDKTPTVFDFGSFSAMNQVYSNISILTQTTYTALLNQALFAAARLRLNCSVDVYTYLFTSTNDIIDISRALNYAPTLLNCGRSILVGMNYADMGSLRQLNFPVNIYWPQGPPVPPTPSSDWMTQFIFKDCTTISYPCLNKVMFVVNQCGDPSFFSLQQYFLSYELMTPYWTNPERFAYLRYYNEDEVPYTALNDFGTFSTMDDLRAIINGTTSMACQTTEVTPYMTKMKRKAKIEVAKNLPEDIKRSMIEGLYRIGWDASKIIKETSMPRSTVYDNIKRFEEKGTTRRSNDAGTRLKVIEWARKYGSESAAKKFNVDALQIKDWMKGNWGL